MHALWQFVNGAIAGLSGPVDGMDPELAGWAHSKGISVRTLPQRQGLSMLGQTMGFPWRIELGPSSRAYIPGQEFRARANLGLNPEIAVLVLNRPLKEALADRAYELYTDTLRTHVDPNLPEELRWLSLYPEVAWKGLPTAFCDRYAILAEQAAHAQCWLQNGLLAKLSNWPDSKQGAHVPFTLMLLRGKIYLRMQYNPAMGMQTLEHATAAFELACELGMTGLRVAS